MSNIRSPTSPRQILTPRNTLKSPKISASFSSPRIFQKQRKIVLSPLKGKNSSNNEFARNIKLIINNLSDDNYSSNFSQTDNFQSSPLITTVPSTPQPTRKNVSTAKVSTRLFKDRTPAEINRENALSISKDFYNKINNIENIEVSKENIQNCKFLTTSIFQCLTHCNLALQGDYECFSGIYRELENQLKTIVYKLISIVEPKEGEETVDELKDTMKKQQEELTQRYKTLKEYISCQEKTIKEKEEEIKELERKTFLMKSDIEQANFKVKDMVEVTRIQRSTIATKEAQLNAMSKKSTDAPTTLGNTPQEIIRAWDSISHFINLFRNGILEKLDKTPLFPEDPVSNPPESIHFFIPRDKERKMPEYMHFTEFFKEIKDSYQEDFYKVLEKQISNFLFSISKDYSTNFIKYKEMEKRIIDDKQTQLNNIRNHTPDENIWISLLIENKVRVKLPKKIVQLDLLQAIDKTVNYTSKTIRSKKHYFATDYLFHALHGIESIAILSCISEIAKQAQTNPEVDLFKNFLTRKIPFHAFILYSYILSNKATLANDKDRLKFIKKHFTPFGYSSLPKETVKEIESSLPKNEFTFIVGTLSMYLTIIDGISKHYMKITDANEMIQELTTDEEEQSNIYDFISFLSFGKINVESFSVSVFWKGVKIPNALEGFSLETNEFYKTYVKPKK